MEELLTIYEWPEKLLNKELKTRFTTKIEKLYYPEGHFGNLKCQNCRRFYTLSIYKTTHLILVDVWFCIY